MMHHGVIGIRSFQLKNMNKKQQTYYFNLRNEIAARLFVKSKYVHDSIDAANRFIVEILKTEDDFNMFIKNFYDKKKKKKE